MDIFNFGGMKMENFILSCCSTADLIKEHFERIPIGEENDLKAFVTLNNIQRNKSAIEIILEDIFPKEILRCIEPTEFSENYLQENEIDDIHQN